MLKVDIEENEKNIASCMDEIEAVKNLEAGNTTNWAKEIQWQIKLINRVFITNARDEKEATDIMSEILNAEPQIVWMVEKNPARTENENTNTPSEPKLRSYVVELTKQSKQDLMNRKIEFFKANRNCRIEMVSFYAVILPR